MNSDIIRTALGLIAGLIGYLTIIFINTYWEELIVAAFIG
jgi:hypothetical protein